MITPFSLSSLPVTRWQNGLGETREIVRVMRADAPFLWRASIATLQEDGPFSRFEGIDRVIVLLEGAPLWLRGDSIEHYLERGVPWAFAGEWPLASEGITGKGLDFNIMTLRGAAQAEVRNVTTTQCPGEEGLAYVLQGEWEIQGRVMKSGEGIWWQAERPGELVPHTDGAALLLTEIRRSATSADAP